MNAKKILAAFAVFAATGSAFADQLYPFVEVSNFQSTKTRAEVMAELRGAQADGSYAAARQEYVKPAAGFKSGKTRAQVIAELEQSVADGSYAVAHQEFQGQYPQATDNAGTRLAGKAGNANAN